MDGRWEQEFWLPPFFAGFWVAIYKHPATQILIDPKTGQNVLFYKRHSLFFIPMHWWGLILVFISLPMMGTHKTPEQLTRDRQESALRKQEREAVREVRRAAKERSAESKP